MTHPDGAASPSTLRRELRVLALVGGFSLLVLPFLVYAAGALTLGPYEGGLGAFLATLYGDFVRLAPGAWALLVGPYVLFQALRFLTRPIRHARRHARRPPAGRAAADPG